MVAKSQKSRGVKPKKASTKKQETLVELPGYKRIGNWFVAVWRKMVRKNQQFLARRPHRSFRLTRRRDYVRSLHIQGYVAFTLYVNRMFRQHWKLFGLMIIIYAVIMGILGVITSQDTYAQIDSLLQDSTSDFFGQGIGKLGQAGVVALSAFMSSPGSLQPAQAVYMLITLLFAWLATVWLLREILLGRKPKLRDGLYNSGAPVLSLVCVIIVFIVQLIPIGLIVLAYAALSSVGVIDNSFANMLFWLITVVISTMVLYWVTSTIIAMVVVTLPGMYPMRALKLSGDLVVGRRLRITLRLLWGLLMALATWAAVIIAAILIDNWIKLLFTGIKDVPIVPYVGALMTAFALVWYAMYVYLFYRKVVDDNAKPA